MKWKRFLLATSSISFLIGIGSCAASFLVPSPSPNTDWTVSNGMNKWDSMKDQYTFLKTPDWCEEMALPQDGGYSEVTCYFISSKKQDQNTYDSVRCIFEAEDQGIATSCELRQNSRSISTYEAGKWKRFFGTDTLLPAEQFFIDLEGKLSGWGLFLVFISTPTLLILFLITAVASGRKKKIQSGDNT